ncbi:MAG: TfoX/Sxy family protein [Marinifilaceae bacterium]|jgi:DNA transformation protein|nr:TfoX/Sxy family protein [Marinifilaceae bacterium]
MNKSLSDLPNIGEVLANKLYLIGITSEKELMNSKIEDIYIKLKQIDDSVCYNILCAIQGAKEGIRWHNLSIEKKTEIKEIIKCLK